MRTETIQVIYKPVTVNGYHEPLVYPAAHGKQEFASNTSPAGDPAVDLVKTGNKVGSNILGPINAPFQTETVATDAHLVSQRNKIREPYAEVGTGHFTYSSLTQNSNLTGTVFSSFETAPRRPITPSSSWPRPAPTSSAVPACRAPSTITSWSGSAARSC